jgi:hypothetical protein
MPWKSLAGKSKRLAKSPGLARAAGRQASAILRSGAPEGVAIATALKHANSKLNRARATGQISPRAERKHLDVDATATMQ